MFKYVLWLPIFVVLAVLIGSKFIQIEEPQPVESVQPVQGSAYFLTDAQVDNQGAVSVEVTQVNLNGSDETLDFHVAMNTHSVNLGMDLVEQAVLTTDTGLTVVPSTWDGASGGHHVDGTLTFPAIIDEKSVVAGVNLVTLTIHDIDGIDRVFTWTLQQAE